MSTDPTTPEPADALPENATGVWEVTTHNGTRHLLDLDSGVSMRLPAVHAQGRFAGRTNPFDTDGQWRLLRFYSAALVGHSMSYGPSMLNSRDNVRTSAIAGVRLLPESEVPPPPPTTVTPTLPFLPGADDVAAYTANQAGYSGGGATPRAAIEALAVEMDPELDDLDQARWARHWIAAAAALRLPAEADRATRLAIVLRTDAVVYDD